MKNLAKCILVLTILCGFAVPVAPVQADEAVRVYLELTADSTTLWPTLHWPAEEKKDYLRGRAVFLDGNGDLADSFNGKDISAAELLLESANYGSLVRFADKPATTTALVSGDWEPAASVVSLALNGGWHEFAVSYDEITQSGTDVLFATLRNGDETIYAEQVITVLSPLANCYVARTGDIPNPALLDPLQAPNNDGGNTKATGEKVTVECFAAFYNVADGKYYYTDRLPAGADAVTCGDVSATLVNGYVMVSADAAASFKVEPAATESRQIGIGPDDVIVDGSDEYVKATKDKYAIQNGIGSDDFKEDTTSFKKVETPATRITIVGLPVNQVESDGTTHKLSGFNAQDVAAGTELDVSDKDAFKLLPAVMKQSSFRVPGIKDQTYIYGAIVGLDDAGAAAPFTNGNVTATFYLRRYHEVGGTAGTVAVDVGIVDNELNPVGSNTWYSEAGTVDGTAGGIKGYNAQKGFLPFRIKATAATAEGTFSSITQLYISDVKLWNGTAHVSDKSAYGFKDTVYADIDEVSEGVNFIAQDTIEKVDLSAVESLDGEAGDDAEVAVTGKGDEKNFTLRVLRSDDTEMGIGYKNTTTSLSEVAIANDSGMLAREDVAIFTSVAETDGMYFVFTGSEEKTRFVSYVDGASIAAADPAVSVALESDTVSAINVILDDAQDHDTVVLSKNDEKKPKHFITAKDMFSNAFGATGALLEDADLEGTVYVRADNGTATTTEFPGSSVRIEGNDIRVGFSLGKIDAQQDEATLVLTTKDGGSSVGIPMNLQAVSGVGFANMFAPVPGVSGTPIEVYLANQNGAAVAPVTLTGSDVGNEVQVSLEIEDGTLVTGSSPLTLTTVAPREVVAVKPDDDKTLLKIKGESSGYDDGTFSLDFTPDFEPPYVGDYVTEDCRISFEVTDNQALNLQGTEITIVNAAGVDISSTLNTSYADNGTVGTFTVEDFLPPDGTYTATIVVEDQWHNQREVTRPFALSCEPPDVTEGCVVSPASMLPDELEGVVSVSSPGSDFLAETPQVAFVCSDGTVLNVCDVEAVSSEELSVTISSQSCEGSATQGARLGVAVASSARQATPDEGEDDGSGEGGDDGSDDDGNGEPASGIACDIVITTGANSQTCEDAFTIGDGPVQNPDAECLLVTPAAVVSGVETTITITGQDTAFTNDSVVAFDCNDVMVASEVSADSAEQLTVSITSVASAATATCGISVDGLSCGELTLQLNKECRIVKMSPSTIKSGRFLPRFYMVMIKGSGSCRFTLQSDIDFGSPDITVKPLLSFGGKRVLCLVKVNKGTAPGSYNISADNVTGIPLTIK